MIWACASCNNDMKSATDELLRDFLAASTLTQGHPAAREAFEAVLRNTARQKTELRRYAQHAKPVYIPNKAGIQIPSYEVRIPSARAGAMLSWIVRGLHVFYCGRPIPRSSLLLTGLHHDGDETLRRVAAIQFDSPLVHEQIGNGDVFECWYTISPDGTASYWALRFYQSIVITVYVGQIKLMTPELHEQEAEVVG